VLIDLLSIFKERKMGLASIKAMPSGADYFSLDSSPEEIFSGVQKMNQDVASVQNSNNKANEANAARQTALNNA
jgi:hypothetical protein